MSVSLVGDGIFLIAIAWTAYSLWNTPAALSVVGIAMTVPTIACLLLGGAISDRFDRRRVLLYSDLGRALAVGVLAALALAHVLTFAMLVIIVAVYGIGAAFFTPAFESIVPAMVDPSELAQANALDQFVRPIALRLVGPALGGVLVGSLGVGSAFALDAGSFVVSAAAVLAMRASTVSEPAAGSTVVAVADGFRFVRRNVWLWGTLLSAAVAYLAFLGPTETLLPFVVKNTLHGSATDLGIVFAAGGVGAIGAAAVMGQRGQPRRDITVIYLCWTLATLAVVGYGLARTAPAADARVPALQRTRGGRDDHVVDGQAAPHPFEPARTHLKPRLADLDQSAPGLIRDHRPRRQHRRRAGNTRGGRAPRIGRDPGRALPPRHAQRGGLDLPWSRSRHHCGGARNLSGT